MRFAFLNALFFLGIGGAWAWYHVAPPQPPTRLSFTATTNVSGFKFKPESVGETAAATLATTNLFNGTFYGPKGERITAFMGEWRADNSKELSVVQHTPDVCWVGAGWTPSANDHPSQVEFAFGDERIPFEVRTFKPPGGGFRELTVWCTLVNGQVYGEFSRFTPPTFDSDATPKAKMDTTVRRVAGGQFLNAVRNRTAGSGEKQFVRFSAPLSGDWRPVLRDLEAFAQQWLALEAREAVSGKR